MAGKWTNEDKREILKTFTVLATIQKTYGKDIDIKPTLQAWEFLLDDYPANSVIEAMKVYMKTSSDMPTPADIIAILSPVKPKITQAEYIHAQKQHALEGYPMHGYYGGIIREYEAQEADGREKPLEIADSLKQSIGLDVKRIG